MGADIPGYDAWKLATPWWYSEGDPPEPEDEPEPVEPDDQAEAEAVERESP